MAGTAADTLMDVMQRWGIDVIFGRLGVEDPGVSAADGLVAALSRRRGKVRFIQARHEESAAFMACAYAKYTGKLGACLTNTGTGAVHMLNGLYDAKMDGQPVLAITARCENGRTFPHHFNDVDLDRVFADVSVFSERISDPAQAGRVVDVACRTALSSRGVAQVILPAELYAQAAEARVPAEAEVPEKAILPHPAGLPTADELQQAAAVLNAGRKIVILAGQGALDATDELEALAARLGAPIIKALLGKAAVPDDSPYSAGGIGLLGTRPAQEAMEECDTLFIVGSSFPYLEFLPQPGQARGVQVDIDPCRIGLRYPVEVGMVGDSRRTLQALLPHLVWKEDRRFLEKAQEGMTRWWKLMAERGTERGMPMKPQVVAWELGNRLTDDAIVSCDSGTIATWFARQMRARRGQKYSLSGTLASMANGLPYTIAAQIAFPERQCVAFVGDGGFSMLMGEFLTAVRYDLPIKVVVVKNNALGQIRWEQMVMLGNPDFGIDLQPIDFAAYAQACGGAGFTIEDPAECGDTLDAALATPGPVVVQAVVDPDAPPLPAKVTPRQAAHFAETLARGEPHAMKIALTAGGEKLREMI